MPSNKPSGDEKESGGGALSQSTEDEIKVLISELKKVRTAHASFRDIKASLLDVIDSINLAEEDSKAQCDEIYKALSRDASSIREGESEENERQEFSKVVSPTGEGSVVELCLCRMVHPLRRDLELHPMRRWRSWMIWRMMSQ